MRIEFKNGSFIETIDGVGETTRGKGYDRWLDSLMYADLPTNAKYLATALEDMEHPRLPCWWSAGVVYGVEISEQSIKIGSECGSCTYRRNQFDELRKNFEFEQVCDEDYEKAFE